MRRLSKNITGPIPAQGSESGFAFVSIIMAIVIFSVLGVALVKISSSSFLSLVGANSSMKAYYLAEGGYRYAGSQFLHAGTSESARDDRLLSLHGTTSTMSNGFGSFSLQSYPWFYKSRSAGSTTSSLRTEINGDIPSGLTIPSPGKISVGGSVYGYSGVSMSGSNPVTVTFNNISPNFAAVPADKTTVLPVAVSTTATQTVDNVTNRNLVLASGTSAFPSYSGTFRLTGSNTVFGYQSRSGNTLLNITDYANPAGTFNVSVPSNTNITLLKYLELHSTGTVGSGIMSTSRKIKYSGPIASVLTDQGGGSSPVIPTDNFDNKDNWLPNNDNLVHGRAEIDSSGQVPGGGTALSVTGKSGSDHFVLPASSIISNALKGLWSWSNGLSYDAQVKIAVTSNISYANGLYFRRHRISSGNNTSFGIAVVYLKDYNDRNIDVYADTILNGSSANNSSNSCYDRKNSTYCLLAAETPYLVLWKDTAAGPSSFKTIAYSPLPANYPLDSPYWPTLMVRIKEKPSAPSYCGTLAGTRVNEIQIYYSTNSSGSGDSTATNTTRVGNLRGDVNWPPDTGGTNTSNDYFTLVGWSGAGTGTGPGWSSGSYQFGNPGDGANTVVCTTDNLTNMSSYGTSSGPAANFPPEVALAALGNNIQNHVWFDDFAISTGPGGGVSVIGFLPPIQQ